MNKQEFEQLVHRTFEKIQSMMLDKGEEYSPNADRLENFKRAAPMRDQSPTDVLIGYVTKQFTSLSMMAEEESTKSKTFPIELWESKAHDVMIYMMLLLGLQIDHKEGQKCKLTSK